MRKTKGRSVPGRTPAAVAVFIAVALAACGQLQAAPGLVLGKAAMANQQTAKAVAQLAKGPLIDPSEESDKAPSADVLDTLADLNELAPRFTDDNVISVRVHTRLTRDATLRHLAVFVTTDDGVVTLKGVVESDSARERAIEIARHVKGVKQVEDQLVVDQKLS
jgi:osmotically-inducible protein OsmY